jgi:putative redox protein
VWVDQPLAAGGTDAAPTPSELFVASLATCAAYYAGQCLERHGLSRTGFAVHAKYRMADRPPARIASIHLRVIVPAGLPVGLVRPLRAVVSHCTVHNTLREPPTVDIQIDGQSFWRRAEGVTAVGAGTGPTAAGAEAGPGRPPRRDHPVGQ